MRVVPCDRCGTPVSKKATQFKHYPKTYCSHACRYHPNIVTVDCATCGVTFPKRINAQTAAYRLRFCSRACQEDWTRQHATYGADNPHWGQVGVTCSTCGATFTRSPRNVKPLNYCSVACSARANVTTAPVQCATCGKTLMRKANLIAKRTQHFCSYRCMGDWKRLHGTGSGNPHWKGGRANYYGPNWQLQRDAARMRDGFTCQHCGVHESRMQSELHVHHIKPFRTFGYRLGFNDNHIAGNDLSNLISLCKPCHYLAEHGRIPVQLRLGFVGR